MDDTKKCRKCGETKPTSHFNASSKAPYGINPRCAACVNAARRANTRRKKEKPEESAGRLLIAAAKKGDLANVKKLYRRVPDAPLEALIFWTMQAHGPKKEPSQVKVCNFFLSKGANPNACFAYGSLLCLAASVGVGSFVEVLKKHGAKTDIYSAAAFGDVAGVRSRLKRNQKNAVATDGVGKTALHHCGGSRLWRGDASLKPKLVQVATLLIDAGADIDAEYDDVLFGSAFCLAASHGGNDDLAQLLLERGADNTNDRLMYTVLRSVKRHDDEFCRIADLMLEHGTKINGNYVDGLNQLYGQARHEDVQATKWLLSRGADIHQRIDDGRTALHAAADRNVGTKVIAMLLEAGAEINARDELGKTPLFYAQQSEKQRVVDFLTSHGGKL
ncbi:MAG: hypothetical protein CMJ78_23825 [Planctomycetaceae bacterium]|nr:hypothetical protein [Planctomycetaceae bacterium]